MSSNDDKIKTDLKDYEIILISLSIEFANGEKGIVTMSIPHEIIHSLAI